MSHLVLSQVSKWFGPVLSLSEVSIRLKPGITGLVGPNGAGKSTLMKLATGQLKPDLGTVTVCDHNGWSASAKRFVGFCPDHDVFYEEMSGRKFVQCIAKLNGLSGSVAKNRTDELLQMVGMTDRANRKLKGYSKGMRQRIKLAQALIHDPKLLILDEPFNGVDPVGRVELQQLLETLAGQGKSILVSSHQLEELEKLTQQTIIIFRGMIVAEGSIESLREKLEGQPFTVKIEATPNRRLAAQILAEMDVQGVELHETGLFVRALHLNHFFTAFAKLMANSDYDLQLVEIQDVSTQAVLDYVTNN